MKRFYVYRKGYNLANQPKEDGMETMRVATIAAPDEQVACQAAVEFGVTVYCNQSLHAVDADVEDRNRIRVLGKANLLERIGGRK